MGPQALSWPHGATTEAQILSTTREPVRRDRGSGIPIGPDARKPQGACQSGEGVGSAITMSHPGLGLRYWGCPGTLLEA